jgi:hypothetical protein
MSIRYGARPWLPTAVSVHMDPTGAYKACTAIYKLHADSTYASVQADLLKERVSNLESAMKLIADSESFRGVFETAKTVLDAVVVFLTTYTKANWSRRKMNGASDSLTFKDLHAKLTACCNDLNFSVSVRNTSPRREKRNKTLY